MVGLSRLFGALTILHFGVACSGVESPNESNAVGGSSAVASGGAGSVSGGTASLGGSTNSVGGSGVCGGVATLGTVAPLALKDELSQPSHSFLLINVHVPLAGNIPGTDADIAYTNVSAIEQFIGSDKAKPVVIYCYSDHMATIAGPSLVADGYCNVRYLKGGLSAWQSAGYPVDATPP